MGYKRYSLLGAILTSIILIIGSILVLWENIPKVFAPEPVDYNGMLVLGIVAILVNLAASKVVSHGHSHNESILSLHFLEDILGWLAVILVSIVLRFTDWYFLDPLLSILISGFILSQALPKFWDNIKILLDHVPSDIDLGQLYQELGSLDNVQAIAQLNVWTTDGIDKYAMIHICIDDIEKSQQTRQAIHQLVKTYGIVSATIECDGSMEEHREHRKG